MNCEWNFSGNRLEMSWKVTGALRAPAGRRPEATTGELRLGRERDARPRSDAGLATRPRSATGGLARPA